jgi:hypothetical protein
MLVYFRLSETCLQRWQNGYCWQGALAEEEVKASQESRSVVRVDLPVDDGQLHLLTLI